MGFDGKTFVAVSVGVTVGMFVAPVVVNMLPIPKREGDGFGLDTVVEGLVVAGVTMLAVGLMGSKLKAVAA